jgi:hypothetical protein
VRPLTAAVAASVALHAAVAALPGPGDGTSGPHAATPLQVTLIDALDSASALPVRDDETPSPSRLSAPVRYYTSAEVDIRATPLEMKTRPRTAANFPLGRIATARLRLFINERGTLDSYQILEAKRLPDRALLEDFREVRFRPAQRKGRPVKSQKVVEISFIP